MYNARLDPLITLFDNNGSDLQEQLDEWEKKLENAQPRNRERFTDRMVDGFNVYSAFCSRCGDPQILTEKKIRIGGVSLSSRNRIRDQCSNCCAWIWFYIQDPIVCGHCGQFKFQYFTGDDENPVSSRCREISCPRFTKR